MECLEDLKSLGFPLQNFISISPDSNGNQRLTNALFQHFSLTTGSVQKSHLNELNRFPLYQKLLFYSLIKVKVATSLSSCSNLQFLRWMASPKIIFTEKFISKKLIFCTTEIIFIPK